MAGCGIPCRGNRQQPRAKREGQKGLDKRQPLLYILL